MVLAGSVWVADTTNDLSTFDLLGNAITASPGLLGSSAGVTTIASPLGVAFDASGDLWIASSGGVSTFTGQNPTTVSSTPYTVGGVTKPLSLAVDGLDQIWVENDNGTVSVLTKTGAAVSPSTGYKGSGVSSTVGAIAIDVSGSVWVTNNTDNSVTQILGAAGPVSPPSTSLFEGTTGVRP
jgi:ligand-binding sensor domain-containing protein